MAKWELITKSEHELAERIEAPGGWVYRTTLIMGSRVAVALCFVPKPPEMSLKEELEESAKALNLPPADQNCSLGGK